jgi:hypothetical protein
MRGIDEAIEDEAYAQEGDGTMAVGALNAIAKYIPTIAAMSFSGDEERMTQSLGAVDEYFTAFPVEKQFKSRKGA